MKDTKSLGLRSNSACAAASSSTKKERKTSVSIPVCPPGKKRVLCVATLFAAAACAVLWQPEIKAVTVNPGTNVPGTTGSYELLGNATWAGSKSISGTYTIQADPGAYPDPSVSKPILTVTSSSSGQALNSTGDIFNLYNVELTRSGSAQSNALFVSNGTATYNLDGSVIKGINQSYTGTTRRGAVFSPIESSGAVTLNINGGTAGVVFEGNYGSQNTGGVIGLGSADNLSGYANRTLNMSGNVAFLNNRTGNFGGAIIVHGYNTGSASQTGRNILNFNQSAGQTLSFIGNSSNFYGGAIDFFGAHATANFNGETEFINNYVQYLNDNQTSFTTPNWDSANKWQRGGAINVGALNGYVTLNFNERVAFTGNRVIAMNGSGDWSGSGGGAISASRKDSGGQFVFNFSKAAVFTGNYVLSPSGGQGHGGAIFHFVSNAVINLGPGSQFVGNAAQTSGGAIYMSGGTISLTADSTGDILFEGNVANPTWSGSGNSYSWTGGTRNAIQFGGAATLNVSTSETSKVMFKDPIAGSAATINKNGTGDLIFYDYSSTPTITTNVNRGRLVLENEQFLSPVIEFGTTSGGTLTVGNGTGFAAIVGGTGTRFKSQKLVLNADGRIIVEDDSLLAVQVGSGGLTVNNNAGIGGHGIVRLENASQNPIAITTGGAGNNFYLTTPNAGDNFRLESSTAIIQAGIIGSGKLHKEGPGTFYANGFTFPDTTGRNKNTYTGGTAIWDGTLRVSDFGQGDALASKSTFSLGTGAVEVNADSPAGAYGRLAIDLAPLDVNGTYTINNAITTSTTTGGEVYVDLARVPSSLTGLPDQNTLVAENMQNFKGDFHLRNLQYVLTSGSAAKAITNANLIVGPGSFITVPTGDTKMAGLNLAGGILHFTDLGYQFPIVTSYPRMKSFVDAMAVSPKGVLALGTYGTDPVSYIRLEGTADDVRDVIEGSNNQPNTTPLLLQDNYGNLRQLASARTTTGGVNNVIVQVKHPSIPNQYVPYVYVPSSASGIDLDQGASTGLNVYEFDFAQSFGSSVTANAQNITAKKIIDTTAANLNTGPGNDGLYLGTKLSELNLQQDKITLFDNASTYSHSGGNDFIAKISGAGHLGIVGRAGGPALVLSHAQNSYSGATVVYTGTLQGGVADAIGTSSVLWVKPGATFDTGVYAQSVNTIYSDVSNPGGIINIPLGGSLTVYTNLIAAGQNAGASTLFRDRESFFNGNLKGSGDLTLRNYYAATRGGVLNLAGQNEFTGDIYFDFNITGTPDADCNVAGLNLLSTANLGSFIAGRYVYSGDIIFGNSNRVKTTLTVRSATEQMFAGDISGPAGINGGKNTLFISGVGAGSVATLLLTGSNFGFLGDIAVGAHSVLGIAENDALNALNGKRYLIGGTFRFVELSDIVSNKPWAVDPVAGGTIDTDLGASLSALNMSSGPAEFGGSNSLATGSIKKTGIGDLTLTGNSTLTGTPLEGSLNIEIRSGNLTVSGRLADNVNGGYKGAIGIEDGSVLTFSTPTPGSLQWLGTGNTITQQDYDLSGGLIRTGAVVKTGPGTLGVDGAIAAPFSMQAGVLEGSGSIVNPTFAAGIVISPGTSSEHDHFNGIHHAGTVGTFTLGKSGSTTNFEGIIYKLDVDHNVEVGGAGSGYYLTDLISVPGSATFGSGGAATQANRNIIDVSDMNATGGVHTPGTPWATDRKYVILHADEGINNTTAADLAATTLQYKGISIDGYAASGVRLAGKLSIENGTDLVFETKSAPSTDLTWNYFGAGSRTWVRAGTDQDWKRTASPYSDDFFYNLDTVRFEDAIDITKNVDVTTDSGGVIVSDMFVVGTNFVFSGGNIVGSAWELAQGAGTVPTKGRLTIETGASARFNNVVDMEDIVVNGAVVFNNAVGSKGHTKSGGDYTGYSLTIGGTGSVVLDSLGTFTPAARPVMSILNSGTLTFSRAWGHNYTYGGVISGAGAVHTNGGGKVILTGDNISTGSVFVDRGGGGLYINGTTTNPNFIVSGTSTYTDPGAISADNPGGWVVEHGGTLGGKGTLNNLSNITLQGVGAVFAPGVSGDGAALVANDSSGKRQQMTISDGGSVVLSYGATFLVQIMGDGSGGAINTGLHFDGSGTLASNAGGNVRLSLVVSNYTIKVGDTFTLIDGSTSVAVANDILWTDTYGYTALANSDQELKNSYAFKYKIFSDGDHTWMQITAIIPEPSTYGLLSGLGLLGLLAYRHRRRKNKKAEKCEQKHEYNCQN
ncbi:MAG: PEP-CTERM sorting domain-containing protein [Puniceicoccales bacterium]|jgi:hypothetical protein|nr:PEP-CTERM sorting domain-containing protein [Puniceicoccales bacterium]